MDEEKDTDLVSNIIHAEKVPHTMTIAEMEQSNQRIEQSGQGIKQSNQENVKDKQSNQEIEQSNSNQEIEQSDQENMKDKQSVKDKQVKDDQAKDKQVKDKQVKDKQVKDKQGKDKQSEDKQAEDKQVEDTQAEDKQSEDNQSEDKQAEDKQAEDNQSEDKQVEDTQAEDKQSEDKQAEDKQSDQENDEVYHIDQETREYLQEMLVKIQENIKYLKDHHSDFVSEEIGQKNESKDKGELRTVLENGIETQTDTIEIKTQKETEIQTELETEDDIDYADEPPETQPVKQDLHEDLMHILNTPIDSSKLINPQYFLNNFKKDILDDPTCIIKYTYNLHNMMKKPFYLLHSINNLYIAKELFGNVWYICYRDLMMIDCDLNTESADINAEINKETTNINLEDNKNLNGDNKDTEKSFPAKIEEYKTFLWEYCIQKENHDKLFMLFRSKRGIHVFLISHKKNYNDIESLKMMLLLKGDVYHSSFSYCRGYCCRLNKKNNDDLPNIYDFIGYIGFGKPLKSLLQQVMVHIDAIPYFEGTYCELSTRFIVERQQ